jgi:protein SCO1/2
MELPVSWPASCHLLSNPTDVLEAQLSGDPTGSFIPSPSGDYTIDHTALALLFNADGSYADAIAYNEDDASARQKIKRLIAAND